MQNKLQNMIKRVAGGGGFSRSGGGPPVIVDLLYDEFNGTDGTVLDAHTMDLGPGWFIDASAWEINANRAVSTDFGAITCSAPGVSNYWVTKESGTAVGCELVFRFADGNNFWSCRVRDDGGLGWVCELIRCVGGVETAQLQHPTTISNVFPHSIGVNAQGTTIEAWFDGILEGTIVDSTHENETLCGFRSKALAVGGTSDCRLFYAATLHP